MIFYPNIIDYNPSIHQQYWQSRKIKKMSWGMTSVFSVGQNILATGTDVVQNHPALQGNKHKWLTGIEFSD